MNTGSHSIGPNLWTKPPADARPLFDGKAQVGLVWEEELGRFCLLTDVVPSNTKVTLGEQTDAVFRCIESRLTLTGFTYLNVIRTWFYLDNIHHWYGEFNRVRNQFYRERGLLGRAPASTAVGAGNADSVSICAHVLAFEPRSPLTRISNADSPLQGSALDYGSAFSRALKLTWPAGQRLYISGTASIDSLGNTLHVGDATAQVVESFRVAQALLRHHGFGTNDVTRALAYIPSGVDVGMVRRHWHAEFPFPFAFLQADICRANLEFELEMLAEQSSC